MIATISQRIVDMQDNSARNTGAITMIMGHLQCNNNMYSNSEPISSKSPIGL